MRALPLVLLLLACTSCDPALMAELDMVKASDLAGTYTGVLEGVSVATLDDLQDPQMREEEAIRYVNEILRLISAAQRAPLPT